MGVGPMVYKEMTKMALMELDVMMTSEQKVLLSAMPVTAAGNPDEVEGDLQFAVMSGDCVLGDRVSPTQMWLLSGSVGDSEVRVSGDADLGAGVVEISGMYHVHVLDPVAAALDLTAGEPELK